MKSIFNFTMNFCVVYLWIFMASLFSWYQKFPHLLPTLPYIFFSDKSISQDLKKRFIFSILHSLHYKSMMLSKLKLFRSWLSFINSSIILYQVLIFIFINRTALLTTAQTTKTIEKIFIKTSRKTWSTVIF